MTPRAFRPLLKKARFKGARGGRGAGKSHLIAERLIADCLQGHHRVVCTREFQSSIRESSKQMLEDKIRRFRLHNLFRSTETEIRGPNDSLFMFKGLDGRSADSVRSIVGVTRVWVEEAHRISVRSLETLTPSIRQEEDTAEIEMYFSWNPMSERDPVERLFSEHDPDDPDFVCVTVTYADNPWFDLSGLRSEMERTRRRDPQRYAHVWLGEYQRRSEAAVFRNWRIEEFETPEHGVRFYFGADWGYSIDPTVLVRCFLDDRTLYVDREAYRVGCEIDHTPALFDQIEGSRRWPIRADSARPETISFMKRAGFRNISPAVKGPSSVEDGIEFLRSFDIVVHPRCVHTSDELSRYSWRIDKRTEEVLPILNDKDNHVIDALRYALEGERLAPKPLRIGPAVLARAAAMGAPAQGRRVVPVQTIDLRNLDPNNPPPVLQPPRHTAGAGLGISAEVLARARTYRRS